MARIFSTQGDIQIISHAKKTRQGGSKNTKYSRASNSHRRKPYRGQGRG